MGIMREHVTGFIVGVGTAALGYYVYKRNQKQVDEWLRKQGINVPVHSGTEPAGMTLEELVQEKERLEDLIAERELAAQSETPTTVGQPAQS